MILLFGEKASKSHKNSNIKNHPVENSGILARSTQPKSLLAANEYDMYMFSVQADIDYSQYFESDYSFGNSNYVSEYSLALSGMSETGSISDCTFGGDFGSCACSGFSSLG